MANKIFAVLCLLTAAYVAPALPIHVQKTGSKFP